MRGTYATSQINDHAPMALAMKPRSARWVRHI